MITGPDAEYVYLRRLLHNFEIKKEREENDMKVNEKIKNMLLKKAGLELPNSKTNITRRNFATTNS